MDPATTARKHLSADALFRLLRSEFKAIPEQRSEPEIALADALMAGFAVFSLKHPSLLAFEHERQTNEFNLKGIFGLKRVPCDTQMRSILDDVEPQQLRPAFRSIFRQLQRGKVLEPMVFWQGHYLIASDGTTYHASEQVHCPACLEKKSRNGVMTYYHQMLGLALVHPDHKEVIPLCPEPIIKQDGSQKNDCERNATRRALDHFRREHSNLPVIFVEDALNANAPHLRDLRDHRIRFILAVKPGSHGFLFQQLQQADETGRTQVLTLVDDKNTLHHFRWLTDVSLNEANPEERVNLLDYWEIHADGKVQHFTWITDLPVDADAVWSIMRGGRARWRIENETFNTLKNQGYRFDHNYGHGAKNLSVVFALLMMLAFLVDQTQQLCDSLFQAAWQKMSSKRRLWEWVRNLFRTFRLESMRQLYELLLNFELQEPPLGDTS